MALVCASSCDYGTQELSAEPAPPGAVPTASDDVEPLPAQVTGSHVTKTITATCSPATSSRLEFVANDGFTETVTYYAEADVPELTAENIVSVVAWTNASTTYAPCEAADPSVALCTATSDLPPVIYSTTWMLAAAGKRLFGFCGSATTSSATTTVAVSPVDSITFRYTYTP